MSGLVAGGALGAGAQNGDAELGAAGATAAFSINGGGLDYGARQGSFDADSAKLTIAAKNLSVEELAAVRAAMTQAAEELAQLLGSGTVRDTKGSATSSRLPPEIRARRNWTQSGGQFRSGFSDSRAKGWGSYSG
ncbi:MAG: hypothetical protein WBA28_05300 [Microbacteriaceae bacterium]